ncbi:MAG: DNA topoisomerase, partial [Clostridium sp.]|nr:DNA topoisomerase [Clostridium sp.]
NFKATSYYKLTSTFKTSRNEEFDALYYEKESEKFEDKKALDNIVSLLDGIDAKVIDKQTDKKREYPPYLFNLSNLQGYITSKYKGWTSDKVLKVAQSLYEKKFTTYPRTASVVLEESLEDRARKVLNTLKTGLPYENEIKFIKSKRVFDNSKVESHSAITPTYIKPTGLSKDEEIVYNAIKNRFIMQFMPIAEFEETKITLKAENPEVKGEFIAKGKVQLVEGWRKVEKIDTKDTILPMVSKDENVQFVANKIGKVTKKPPKYHTEKTLLRVKKLKDIGYIKTKGKSLTCTELGRTMVEIFPVKELLDLEYTGRLEKTLSDIEKGRFEKSDFMNLICNFTETAVDKIKNDTGALSKFKVEAPEGKEVVGRCPTCGNPVIEGEKGFGCTNWKNGCKFTIWKDDKYIASFGKQVTKEMVKLLLQNGKVGFRNLKSKKGNTFSAYFKYIKNEETGRYNWEIEFI